MHASRAMTCALIVIAGIGSAGAQSPGELVGSWQLVKFEGGDGKLVVPDDSTKYTFTFEADGHLTARIDCNRGRGTWLSSGAHQLQFGPLALTRAMCAEGSIHDRIVKDLPAVRSYALRGTHLFLALLADSGAYEFQPAASSK
jgi:para-nitrobenzyl esterase